MTRHKITCANAIKNASSITEEQETFARRRLRAAGYVPGVGFRCEKLLANVDKDHNGTLTYMELRKLFRFGCQISYRDISDAQLATMYAVLDTDSDGLITADELLAFAMEGYGQKAKRMAECRSTTYQDRQRMLSDTIKKRDEEEKQQEKDGAEYEKARAMNRLYKCLKKHFGTIQKAFAVLDVRNEGELTYNDFKSGLEKHNVLWQAATGTQDLRYLFRTVNIGSTGAIKLGELLAAEDIGEKHAEYHVTDMHPEARQRHFKGKNMRAAQSMATWDIVRPQLGHAKAVQLAERPRSPTPSNRKVTQQMAEEYWELKKSDLKAKEEWRQESQTKKKNELSKHETWSPEISKASREMMAKKATYNSSNWLHDDNA